ncbi:type I-E CRISPR-associated protein Cas6/Cse3/CasE [Streptomyces sp. NPDC056194]|uniref:type I-E CRISPR-associated protein Cas6/Cse3/CasE n=1 Tax=unclassified Streptomyces TaxID=2593676 RepID=UPI0035D7C142
MARRGVGGVPVSGQVRTSTSRASKHGFDPPPIPDTANPAPGIFPLHRRRTSHHTHPRHPHRPPARPNKHVFTKDLTTEAGTTTGATKVSIDTATYEGRLRGTGPIALVRALITGIGPSKA